MSSSPRGLEDALVAKRPAISRNVFEDDGSPTPSPVRSSDFDVFSRNASSQEHGKSASNSPETRDQPQVADPEVNEDSDDEPRRPMGRSARRMLGGDQSPYRSPEPRRVKAPEHKQPSNDPQSDDELYTVTPQLDSRFRSQPPFVPASAARSTLFVSPAKTTQNDSDDDLPTRPTGMKSKLAALVAEKRAERLEKEAEAASKTSDLPDEIVEGAEEPVNPEIERILSDAAKPTRKASKRALLEMERETQRIARQQALAHQMKTKKKFTTSDLFAKFNFRQPTEAQANQAGDSSASSAPNSDAIDAPSREPPSTPPSSPPTPLDRQRALVEQGALSKLKPVREDSLNSLADLDDDEDLPDIGTVMSSARNSRPVELEATVVQTPSFGTEPKRGLKLARLGKKAMAPPSDDSSDDDLEIVQNMPKHLSVFDRAKGTMQKHNTDSRAIHRLKHLAHLGGDDSNTGRRKHGKARPGMNPAALEAQLRLRAKEQARAQQQERIAELKAKGIEVQTTEEREREQEAFENLLEKARIDAVELRKAEKAAAKENNGGADISADESEDEDYVDVSGSEDEAPSAEKDGNDMVDDAAEEDDEDEEEEDGEDEASVEERMDEETAGSAMAGAKTVNEDLPDRASDEDELNQSRTPMIGRKPRKSRVVLDDEDMSDLEISKPPPTIAQTPTQTQDSDPFAAFNFDAGHQASSLMSPTQMFNATMQTPTQDIQQDSMDVLNHLVPPGSSTRPPPTFAVQPQFTQGNGSQPDRVPSSQLPESQQVNLAWETQAPETPIQTSRKAGSVVASETPGWVPSQDPGLPATWQAPALAREDTLQSLPDQETQSTVELRVSESPAPAPKRNRLVRGPRHAVQDSGDEDDRVETSQKATKKDAFKEMARKRKEALSAEELAEAEREAKQMMDEQAEESEDEYAGLGGDDFVAPETEEDREMIDSSLIDVDERQLAAHFAEKQRLADEAEHQRLYKDLMTGALRRKQANMFDLDEDEDDLAARRRQMKQREEARKRKLLLQDESIASLAEGKHSVGKDAFLKAIADDDERDDDVLDLSDVEDDSQVPASLSDSQASQQPDASQVPLQEVSGNKRRMEDAPSERPPAKQRRTQASAFRAPASLLEIQDSVSFLLEEPNVPLAGPTAVDLSSDSEQEHEKEGADNAAGSEQDEESDGVQEEMARQNDGGYAPDRVAMPPPRLPASQRRTAAKPSVVNRLSLKRASSTSENSAAGSRTAWGSGSQGGGFRAPSLLRRATTNGAAQGANDRGVSTSIGLSRQDSGGSATGVKMGGSKKSSLAYQARDAERKAIVEQSARRRAENTAKIAQLRRNASSGFGKGLGGKFE
ncbi:hypothetical protein CB0940_12013 [Cercospora beticola]|uniref:DNA replication checkpoint mediator MRC1 domain-containing protein n=1 Tax=Cercospora beticola TaxID=122368 RepID=A0A2G5IEQ4_CERBT|nr:hypothetical protein CB0940_12013 [Cercospora beticola]PIB03142.1 hypothetical protein CB0940_12013 [Cercospora beticola]WPB04396.1 hypothetical protein RHO25_009042 [Cercospora beticola]CAK1356776.1 unnamed protein product [Cercospora beticola]